MTDLPPQLATDARDKIMRALGESVDAILARPDAVTVLDAFIGRGAVLVLSHGACLVLPIEDDLGDALERIRAAAADDDGDGPEPADFGSAYL
jgi:hypothetical protein